MSYKNIALNNDTTMLLEVLKRLCSDFSTDELIKTGLTFVLLAQLSVELSGEMVAKFNDQEFDLTKSDSTKRAIKAAYQLLSLEGDIPAQ